MGLSKSQSIIILLGVDAVFFLLEITVGYAVHSLALVADSFHMLNDVLSLLVGLWAVRVSQEKKQSNMYTYGWQRAETVGALVNGVFLVALCLSIVLDAIQRFVEPQEVSQPKLVLIVGCFGLASNLLGLLLFHDHGHGHSHGEEAHEHSHETVDPHSAAEEGHSYAYGTHDDETRIIADEAGKPIDVLPSSAIRNGVNPKSPKPTNGHHREISWEVPRRQSDEAIRSPASRRSRNRRSSRSRSRAYSNINEIIVHPASFRNEIIAAGRGDPSESSTESESETVTDAPFEQTPLLNKTGSKGSGGGKSRNSGKKPKSNDPHKNHKHSKPTASGHGHGHSHGDLNMRGVFLHVLGDALGNIGVIASALFIWLTDFSWRFYADPVISLVITVIILMTAIPLCKAASRILLQAVPAGISIDDLKDDIEALPSIISAHHIHVWQLSDTKFVCSLHVQVEFDFKGEGSARYMELARAIRGCLHEYGIHSSTIQPEFCVDSAAAETYGPEYTSCDEGGSTKNGSPKVLGSKKGSKASSLDGNGNECLLECGDECGNSKKCCPVSSSGRSADGN